MYFTMTQHEQNARVFTINSATLQYLHAGSVQEFGKTFGELSLTEASGILGGVVVASLSHAADSRFATEDGGRTIVHQEADGKDAVIGFGKQWARETAPKFDDERGLIIKVLRNKTFWDKIRRRQPEVEYTYSFRNEPPQYA